MDDREKATSSAGKITKQVFVVLEVLQTPLLTTTTSDFVSALTESDFQQQTVIKLLFQYCRGEVGFPSEILQSASTMFGKTAGLPSSRASRELKVLPGWCIATYYLAFFTQSIKLQEINVSCG